jgi:hypothetical protein
MQMIRSFSLLVAICLCLLPAGQISADEEAGAAWAGPPTKNGRQSYFGLNGTKIFHIPDDMEQVNQRIGWMQELGVHWDRIDMWWHEVEPEKGRFEWHRPDHCIAALESAGIQWYPILCYGARWFEEDKIGPQTDEDFGLYSRYVEQAVTRYKGRVPEWEVWNEPNIPNFWRPNPNADDYTRLLKGAYERIKAADPDARVAAPAIAPLGAWDRKFVERMYLLGAKDYYDIFDYHYYRNHAPEQQVPAELAEIRAVMHRYGDDKPIHISESGVSSIHEGEIDDDRQAALVVRNHLLCLALGVKRFYYFDLQNWRDTMETWDGQLGLVKASGEKKPAFHAYRTLVQLTDYNDFVGRYLEFGDGVQGVLIRDVESDEYIMALWLESVDAADTRTVEVAVSPLGAQLIHADGTRDNFPPDDDGDGRHSVYAEITRAPRYIRGVDAMSYLPGAGVWFERAHTILAPVESSTLGWKVSPLLQNPVLEVLEVHSPDGIEWDHATGRLAVGSRVAPGLKTVTARVQVTHGPENDRRQVILERDSIVEVTPQVNLEVRPYLEDGGLKAHISIANQSLRRIEGEMTLEEAKFRRRPRSFGSGRSLRLEPGRMFEHVLDLPIEEIAAYKEPADLRLIFGPYRSEPFRVHPVVKRANGPTIDGDLLEWYGMHEMVLDEESQLVEGSVESWSPDIASARARVWLTDEALYFSAIVQDSTPLYNPHPPPTMWMGDSFELFVGLQGPTRHNVLDKSFEYQIGIAPEHDDGHGAIAFWFHIDEVIQEAEIATRSTDTGWIIEARIPWTSIKAENLVPKPGDLIALDVKYNDADRYELVPAGNIGGRRLVWNGDASNWINPSRWGMGVVVEE